MRERRIEILLPIAILIIDQATKAIVRAKLPLYASAAAIPGIMDFTHVPNSGIAYGLLQTVSFPFKTVVIAMVSAAAIIGVGIYAAGLAHHQRIARIGLSLIIGGAAGNLIDRLVSGSVVDFIDVYWRTHHFWVFNVADSAITIGVILLFLQMVRKRSLDF